ncbi:methionine--tRNA ligase [archaeon]|nr:methionine--tRNA ligase [archaeon]
MIIFKAKRVTITSALPYVNGIKHLGNLAGSILPADIFHRFMDLFGVDNVYICGTDDHGTAVEIGALEEQLSPQEYSDKYYEMQKEIYKKWNFDFSFFGRSSSSSNHKITQDIFLSAYENGYITKENIVIPFCQTCKRFLPDRYITGTCPHCDYNRARGDQCEKCAKVLDSQDLKEPRCSICNGNSIEFRKEKHLFLNLPLLQQKLQEWIEKQEHWPDNTRNLALGWMKEGLRPRCITRNLQWGVKVALKEYEHLVHYCWFDAPIAYISITKDGYEKGAIQENWKHYWKDSAIYHFIGKDNIPFHTIIWPAILLSARDSEQRDTNYQLPYFVQGYEYLNWEGQKFSTSKGIGLFSDEVSDLFPIDYWRFYLSSVLPESKDSNFDWDDFQRRINNELIANYGNLFYRVTHFIKQNFNGCVPKGQLDEDGAELYKKLHETVAAVEDHVSDVKLRAALSDVFAFSADVNKYFQEKRPWEQKNAYDVGNTIYAAVNLLRSISLMLYPFMPSSAEEALKALGDENKEWDHIEDERLKTSDKIEAKLLFKKIEDNDIEKAKKYVSRYVKSSDKSGIKTSGKIIEEKEKIEMVNEMIPIEEFQKLDLVTGTVVDVKDHPNAAKLYIMEVDIGSETRQIVAGLREKYAKEQLKGKQIILVANLEPKELRGVKSHGMLLAAGDGTLLCPVEPVANGSKVQ